MVDAVYKSNRFIADILMGVFVFFILLECILIGLDIDYIHLLGTIHTMEFNTLPPEIGKHVDDISSKVTNILFLSRGIFFIGMIVFLVWICRANNNLSILNSKKHSSAWIVISFFIPIFNLFYPIMLINSIWQSSSTNNTSKPILVTLCWLFCIIGIIGDIIWFLAGLKGIFIHGEEAVRYFIGLETFFCIMQFSLAISAMLAIWTVNIISKEQELMSKRFQA